MMNLINGDSQEELKKMSADSIDAVVCDPPYGLSSITTQQFNECMLKWCTDDRSFMPRSTGFMGKSWDGFVPPPALWDEVYRVLKPGAHALIFAGSRTQDLMGLSLRLAGFEIRDCIQWIYGSGFPKSLNIGKAVDKIQGNEREMICRNPNSREQCDKSNTLYQSGTVGKTDYITKGSSKWEGWGTALKPAFEPAILIRKPIKGTVASNVLEHGVGGLNIDGCRIATSDDLGNGLVNHNKKTSHYTFTMNPILIVGHKGGRWPTNVIMDQQVECGEWKRFFYCAKASRQEREQGLDGDGSRVNIHPTVKPIDLMRYLCRLITPRNGIILDPFLGSGSTGIAAGLEGFDFVGIEREQEYFEIAESRINYWTSIELTYESNEEKPTDSQLSLFG